MLKKEEMLESFIKNQDPKSAIIITEEFIKGNIVVGNRRNINKLAIKIIIKSYKDLEEENLKLQKKLKIAIGDRDYLLNKLKKCIHRYEIKRKIQELYNQDEQWSNELSEPDSNFDEIDKNLKRIKNQIDILQEILKERK